MGKTQTLPDYPRGLTFEHVWAALMETRETQKETDRFFKESRQETVRLQQETAKFIKESQQETARFQQETAQQIKESQQKTARFQQETAQQIKESQQETDRQIKDINKRFGEYSNRLGEIAEYMITPNLRDKFNEFGYDFSKASRNLEIADKINNIFLEIDVFLENFHKAMLVEIKTNLTEKNINDHIERLEKMRKYSDLHDYKRIFFGAVAGVVIPEDIKKIALDNGLFVVEPSGETFNITHPHEKPKEW